MLHGVLPTQEHLWNTLIGRFRRAFTDTAEKPKAQQELANLRMKGEDLDGYVSKFQNLARKAGFGLDEEGTLIMFQKGLPPDLMKNCVKFCHPEDWDEWTRAANLQHQEYIMLRARVNKTGETKGGATRQQWKEALKQARHPDAMDIGRTRARAALTNEEKQKLQAKGRCFKCQKQGHISHFCPQNQARAAEASTSTINVATASVPTPITPVLQTPPTTSSEERADAMLNKIWVEDDETRGHLIDQLFARKEDFFNA